GIEAEARMAAAILPTVGAADMREAARGVMPEAGRVLLVVAPATVAPTEATVRAALVAAAAAPLTAWTARAADRPLMATLPTPGRIVQRRSVPDSGLTILTLSNGLTVW